MLAMPFLYKCESIFLDHNFVDIFLLNRYLNMEYSRAYIFTATMNETKMCIKSAPKKYKWALNIVFFVALVLLFLTKLFPYTYSIENFKKILGSMKQNRF